MQFRFRYGARVTEALFIARKFIDNAHAIKNNKLILLALDWAKAFDSIMPRHMLAALERFRVHANFCAMIHAIYDSLQYDSFILRKLQYGLESV